MNIVKFYRTVYFLTQTELAQLCGMDQYRISRIEGGKSPSDEEWRALAKAFGMSVAEMKGECPDNTIERYLRSRCAIGHLNGIPEERITKDLCITERQLRKLVQRERVGGALICHDHDDKGYYIAETTAEKQRFLRRRMAVIRSLSRECKAFRDDLKSSGESPCA